MLLLLQHMRSATAFAVDPGTGDVLVGTGDGALLCIG